MVLRIAQKFSCLYYKKIINGLEFPFIFFITLELIVSNTARQYEDELLEHKHLLVPVQISIEQAQRLGKYAQSAPSHLTTTTANSQMQEKDNNGNFDAITKPMSELFESYGIINRNITRRSEFKLAPSALDTGRFFQKIFGIGELKITTTTPKPEASEFIMHSFVEPLFASIKRELQHMKKTHVKQDGIKNVEIAATSFNADENDNSKNNLRRYIEQINKDQNPKQIISNSDYTKKQNNKLLNGTPLLPHILSDEPSPISSLLQFIGMDARQKADEVHIGRDRSLSVLGMPIGRRDGLALSPLTGVSYGNQDMFGPIAINDRYNVKWDFLDKIQSAFGLPPKF